MKTLLLRFCAALPTPCSARWRNRELFDWMNANAPGRRVLNLGSGIGASDDLLSPAVRTVRMDINPHAPGLDIVGDAQQLPFRDESFDIVYCLAVLEHVRRPWVAAAEIRRVLRRGGHVVLCVPFLYVIHDEHDYFRFTDQGIRALFDEEEFEPVLEQVASGGGSFLASFLGEYGRLFVPGRHFKTLWDLIFTRFFSLCSFLDVPVDRSTQLRRTASSFAYIGRKR